MNKIARHSIIVALSGAALGLLVYLLANKAVNAPNTPISAGGQTPKATYRDALGRAQASYQADLAAYAAEVAEANADAAVKDFRLISKLQYDGPAMQAAIVAQHQPEVDRLAGLCRG